MSYYLNRGFTLIELMIVVAIIGIMANYAVPTFQDFVIRTQIEEGLQLTEGLKKTITDYYRQHKSFPADNASAGLPLPQHLIGNYVSAITLQQGALHIQLGHRINRQVKDKILTIRPVFVAANPDSPISWICGYAQAVPGMTAQGDNQTTVPAAYLSQACRAWQAPTEPAKN